MKTLLTAALLLVSTWSAFAVTDQEAEAIFKKMLEAQKASDYDAFVVDADDKLKTALSKDQFTVASTIFNEKFKEGYDLTFLGEVNQRGFQVFLYRLRPKSGDDFIASLSIKDGKVGGIVYR